MNQKRMNQTYSHFDCTLFYRVCPLLFSTIDPKSYGKNIIKSFFCLTFLHNRLCRIWMTFARYLMGVKRRTRILVIARLVRYLKAYVDDDSKIAAIYLKKNIFWFTNQVFSPSVFAGTHIPILWMWFGNIYLPFLFTLKFSFVISTLTLAISAQ